MNAAQTINRLRKWLTRSSAPRRARAARPALEELERREVPTVTWHGGPVLSRVEVQAVYYGSDWNAAGNRALAGRLENYLRYIVNSPYMDMLYYAGYGVGRGTDTPGTIANYNPNKGQWLTDATIATNLRSLIYYRYVAPNDANRLYVVFVEPGVAVWAGNHSVGYHTDSQGIHYAVIPYPGGINGFAGPRNVWDSLTVATSHELAEGVTDPVPYAYDPYYRIYRGAWYDGSPYGGEIGDLATGVWSRLNGYLIQDVANKNDQPIAPYGSTRVSYTSYANVAASAGGFAVTAVPDVDEVFGVGRIGRRRGIAGRQS